MAGASDKTNDTEDPDTARREVRSGAVPQVKFKKEEELEDPAAHTTRQKQEIMLKYHGEAARKMNRHLYCTCFWTRLDQRDGHSEMVEEHTHCGCPALSFRAKG